MNSQRAEELKKHQPEDPYNLPAPDLTKAKAPRWRSLDVARGVAISLMVLSHCVKGLMSNYQIPGWGIVPVHLLTKFSSSLFILVFGVSLSLFFLPHVQRKSWGQKRWWMIKRGIELMIWYKILTVVQMFQFYPKQMIIDTLLFKSMPDFVEILSFYAIALLWLPFFLPFWSRMNDVLKIAIMVGTFALGQWLHGHFDFWGLETLKAILVEEKGYYTFGQLQRGAVVFLGLFIGDWYKTYKEQGHTSQVSFLCLCAGVSLLLYFFISNSAQLGEELVNIAKNIGKHPFDLNFFCFSMGGALSLLGVALLFQKSGNGLLRPISYLGQHSLNAFILHIIIIFYFLRYYFGLHHKVTYEQSLWLTGACLVSIIAILWIWDAIKKAFR